MRKLVEKGVKWLLTLSGFVTSLVILLIIGFLFDDIMIFFHHFQ